MLRPKKIEIQKIVQIVKNSGKNKTKQGAMKCSQICRRKRAMLKGDHSYANGT
jgi:hypothetical protein